jgi:hypothetical protein
MPIANANFCAVKVKTLEKYALTGDFFQITFKLSNTTKKLSTHPRELQGFFWHTLHKFFF